MKAKQIILKEHFFNCEKFNCFFKFQTQYINISAYSCVSKLTFYNFLCVLKLQPPPSSSWRKRPGSLTFLKCCPFKLLFLKVSPNLLNLKARFRIKHGPIKNSPDNSTWARLHPGCPNKNKSNLLICPSLTPD